MKERVVFLTFYMFLSFFIYSQSYANQNGTIIKHIILNNVSWEIRKHNQQVEIGDIPKEENRRIYSSYSQESSLITIVPMRSTIQIFQVARALVNDEYHSWLNVRLKDGISGWMFFGKDFQEFAQFRDPYFNNRWEITGYITTSRDWTIRKLIFQHVSVWEVVNIRDKPGLINTKIISKVTSPPNCSPLVTLLVLEATDEKEIIDGRNDRWLRIKYNNIDGWVFGGYTSVERGGPKYYTPESIIASQLGFYP